jgi:hypothetical protein
MNKMAGIILMVCGVVILLVGFVIFSFSSKDNIQPQANPELKAIVPVTETQSDLLKTENTIIRKDKKPDGKAFEAEPNKTELDKKNGDDFEKFIVQKFDKKYFKIKEWAGDKYVNGIYAETTQNPDILFEFRYKEAIRLFSVECKWRKKLYKNGVEFAKESQLARYRKFESEKNIPVFIAIGISGEASSPEHLYIIPLKNIQSTFLTIEELKRFEKTDDRNFYYNLKSNILN